MQPDQLKKKTFFLIFFIVALSFGVFFLIFYKFQNDRLSGIKEQSYTKVYSSFHKNLQLHFKEFYINKLQTFLTEDMIEAIDKKDKDKLYSLVYEPYFNMQKEDRDFKIMHFHNNDGTSLLRMHEKDDFGDEISLSRDMSYDIHKDQVILSGFELGKYGFYYRIFFPLFLNQKYIGAIEIGISPKKLFDNVTYFNGVDGLLRFYDNDKSILFQKITDNKLKENIFQNGSLRLSKTIIFDDKFYAVYKFKLFSYTGKNIGEFIFFDDLTKIHNEYKKALKQMIITFFFSFLALYGVLHFVFSLYGKKISALYKRTESILNHQKEIVFVTNKNEIIEANKVFFDFFEYGNIIEFKKKHQCISEFFIAEDGFLVNDENYLACVTKLLQYPETKHLAKIKKQDKEYIFKLSAFYLDEIPTSMSEIVISMQDITKEVEQENLLKESVSLFKSIFETFPDSTLLLDLETHLPYAFNTIAYKQLGYTEEEFALLNIENYDAVFSKEEIKQKIIDIKKYGRNDFKSQHRKKDKSIIDVFITTQLAQIDKITYMFIVTRDITKSEQIEKELRNNEKKFRSMFTKHNAPMLLIEPENGKILDANISAENFYGYKLQEFKNMSISNINILTPKEIELERRDAISEERNFFIFEHKLKNNEIKTVEVHSSPFMLKDKEVLFSIIVDITEKTLAQKALVKSEERLVKAQEIAHLGSWELDIATGKLDWSDEVFRILELDENIFKPTYQAFLDSIHPDDREFLDETYKEALEEKKKYSFVHRLIMKDKRIKWVKEAGDTEYDEAGKPILSRGTVQDITEQMRTNEELQLAKEKAEDANKAKSAFLANMSHEIRTPMNAILGLSELVYDMDIEKKEKDIIGKIKSASKMLLGTINDILDYSKIEARKMELVNEPIGFDEILTQLRVIFSESVAKKKLKFNLYIKNNVPEVIVADELRLLQVLSNLLSNSVKFTQEGTITLTVEHLETPSADLARLRFSVIDTGIGMNDKQLLKIFEPFTQADSSTTRKYGGTGLGLVIANKILEMMQSKLEVKSEIGKGSCFSFDINVKVKEWQINYLNRIENSCRVLLLDEHIIESEMIHGMLERFKCQSTQITNIKDMYEILENKNDEKILYDFLLVDWDNKYTKEILEKLPNNIFPIVMVNPYEKDELRAILEENHIITKPITSSILFDKLMTCHDDFAKTEDEQITAVNLKGLHLLLVEDNEINQEVAAMMLEKTGATVDVANNGQEGVDKYFTNKDKYNAILMDLQMPIMSGYEACTLIRKDSKTIPIIALTAAATVEDREKALEAGMDEHLAKPIDSAELYKTIARLCNIPLEYKEVRKKIKSDNSLVLDIEHLYNSLSSKNLGDKLLIKFLHQLENEYKDLAKMIIEKDINIKSIIHSLKGVSGNLYANEFYNTCQKIDTKYKANQEIAQEDIKELEIVQDRLIKRLKEIQEPKQKESEILDKEEFTHLIETIKEKLLSKNILDLNEQKTLLYNLHANIASQDYNELELFLDEYEYDKALEVMDRCKI